MTTSKKRCPTCQKYFPTETMTRFGSMMFCCFDHAVQYANKKSTKDKGRKIAKQESSRARREFNRKDIKWQHKQTQIAFNKMRVLEELLWFSERGLEPECISCGKKNMDWCCGHFKTRGAQPSLRYDRNNTFLQCNRYCNMGLSGNISGNKTTRGYLQGLVDRFGLERSTEIIDYCESNTKSIKWTWEDLEQMRSEFNRISRRISQKLNAS